VGSLSPWQSKTGVRALAGDSCGAWDASGRYPLMDTTPASSCALRSAMIDAAPPCPTWHEIVVRVWQHHELVKPLPQSHAALSPHKCCARCTRHGGTQ